jgi:hypothetical protein
MTRYTAPETLTSTAMTAPEDLTDWQRMSLFDPADQLAGRAMRLESRMRRVQRWLRKTLKLVDAEAEMARQQIADSQLELLETRHDLSPVMREFSLPDLGLGAYGSPDLAD